MKLSGFNDEICTDIEKLQRISTKVTENDIERLMLKNRLIEANGKAWISGCGISAIQIGIPLKFGYLIIDRKEEFLINPKIITKFGRKTSREGCLSIPHRYFDVQRAVTIEYISNGKKKKAKGFKALVIQHEIDHMDGILISLKAKENK